MEELGLRCPELIAGADCALNTRLPETGWIDSKLATIFPESQPDRIIGLNVNSYLGSWQEGEEKNSESRFVELVAEAVNTLAAEVDAKVLLFVTQVMDHPVSKKLKGRLAGREIPVIANPYYTYSQIAGILSRIDLLIGMRTHAQIFAVSVGTPVVNINSYPKTRAFLETVGLNDWSIDVGDLEFAAFSELIRRAWDNRAAIREGLLRDADREKGKARLAVDHIRPFVQAGLETDAR
jgi:polysaccharide pyruvyl transferase WcaK-like protein